MNEKYINKNVSEDDDRYFDFQTFCDDFMEDNYKKVSLLIPKSDTKIVVKLEQQESVTKYIYNLISKDVCKNEN